MKTPNIKYPKPCIECSRPITQKRYRKYCSKTCRTRATNKRHQDYQRDWQLNKRGEPGSHKIQCEICKRYYVQICSHVWQTHGMSARTYKRFLDIDVKKGHIPAWYREIKAEGVTEKTLRNLKNGKRHWFQKGQKGVGIYRRSMQTLQRLRNHIHQLKGASNATKP